mgnify:CR=1 FL=1
MGEMSENLKNESMYVNKQEYVDLKRHSQMLGQIANLVEDFTVDNDDTTEMAVRRILSELYFRRSEDLMK